MKLRMETGNFNIVLDENDQCYLPKGLSQEDLLGAVVAGGGSIEAIISVSLSSEASFACETKGKTYMYDPETGLFSVNDDPGGGDN